MNEEQRRAQADRTRKHPNADARNDSGLIIDAIEGTDSTPHRRAHPAEQKLSPLRWLLAVVAAISILLIVINWWMH